MVLHKLKYLDTIRERLRCLKVRGGGGLLIHGGRDLTPLQTMHEKEQGKDNDTKTTDIIETDNQKQNKAKHPEDLNKLPCIACKRIFKSSSGLKNHQRACKSRDLINDSASN